MRREVFAAVGSLSDVQHQQLKWGRIEEGVNYYDDLSLNIHILYDDCAVLPDPNKSVRIVIHAAEVPSFTALERALGPMIDDLGDAADEVYTQDPRWPSVVAAAGRALADMRANDQHTVL